MTGWQTNIPSYKISKLLKPNYSHALNELCRITNDQNCQKLIIYQYCVTLYPSQRPGDPQHNHVNI